LIDKWFKMQGIPNRDAGAAHNEQGIEDTVAPSIIPPRKPKKLGMPKLQLPAREYDMCELWA
jgi:hypothetical protein